jgi:hypothetical protein
VSDTKPAPEIPEADAAAEPETPLAATETTVLEPAGVSESEPVLATSDAGAAEMGDGATTAGDHRVVYVEAPHPPRKRGNRAVGSLFAVIAAVVYAVLLAIVTFIIVEAVSGVATFEFVSAAAFFVPVLYFAAGFVLLVLILNRASWWAYVLGSIFVALFVYFLSIGTLLLVGGIVLRTPVEASAEFQSALGSPVIIVAALLAREVSLWAGIVISARGRRMKAKNLEAREAFDRDAAARRAEYDGAPVG